jgi:nucleoid DNA-binding protein
LTKSDIIKRLSRQFPGLTLAESRQILDLFLVAMKEGLKSGDTVEMRDFGFFASEHVRQERPGIRERERR